MQYGNRVGSCFLHIVSTLHFSVLNRMFESVLHFSSLARSSCRNWQSSTDFISLYNFESSAYSAEFVLGETLSGRSFMNMTKSNGPRMLPCGTPDVTGDHAEAAPSMTTRCYYRSSSSRTIVKAFRLCLAFEACEAGCHDLQSRTLSRNLSIAHRLVCFGLDSYQYHVVHLEAGLYMNDLLRSHVGHY